MQNEKIVTMRMATAAFLFAASAAGHLACGKVNPYYCDSILEPGCPCAESDDCATGACVAGACALCVEHSQCQSSGVCLTDGTCALLPEVAYVSSEGTDNPDCTKELPCTKVSKALARGKRYVKLSGVIDDEATIDNQHVTFFANPGAKLTSTGSGPLLAVRGASRLAIYDLELAGALGSGITAAPDSISDIALTRVSVHDNATGVSCRGATTLSITQSAIFNNSYGVFVGTPGVMSTIKLDRNMIYSNDLVGLHVEGPLFFDEPIPMVDITNNFIFRNGSQLGTGDPNGEIGIRFSGSAAGVLAFNTIADNRSPRQGIGVDCLITEPGVSTWNDLQMSNNIIVRHAAGGGTSYNTNCGTMLASYVGDLITGLKFRSPDVAPYDYHLMSESGAIDPEAPTPVTVDVDIDGDARPHGVSRDIGADEYHPTN